MSERYTKLYSLKGFLHADGAPVVISGGALLDDSFTHATLVQLKFTSISDKPISALQVQVEARDSMGETIGAPVEYRYSDIKARRSESFGTKAAIVMPAGAVASFALTVTEVLFADGSIWDGSGSYWVELNPPRTLKEALNDSEMCRQFTIRYGNDCEYMPEGDGDLWYCVCGAINRSSESKCYRCRRVYSAQKGINMASLRSETAQRVETEKRADDELQSENRRKRSLALKLALVIIPILAVLIYVLATVPGQVAQRNAYDAAVALLNAEKYDQAQEAFAALGDYNDSREQAEQNIPYLKAMYIMDCAKNGDVAGLLALDMKRSELAENESVSVALYKQAAELFLPLGNYKDSAAQRETALTAVSSYYDALEQDAYNSAAALLAERRFLEARDAFLSMSSYSDSTQMAIECMYQRAVLLYELTEKYFMQGVSARISDAAGEKSVFYITQDAFTALGKEVSADIREVCREDGVEINIAEAPEEGFIPICQAVSQLFTQLANYKDSADYAAKALENGDFTKTFYDYCENGQLYEAYLWLTEYEDEFEFREQWLQLLQANIPYCGTWELDNGNPNLIPMTMGGGPEAQCKDFSSIVTIKDSVVSLQIIMPGFESYPLVLARRADGNGFHISPDGVSTFIAVVTEKGLFQYCRYVNSGLQAGPDACEYSRAAQ